MIWAATFLAPSSFLIISTNSSSCKSSKRMRQSGNMMNLAYSGSFQYNKYFKYRLNSDSWKYPCWMSPIKRCWKDAKRWSFESKMKNLGQLIKMEITLQILNICYALNEFQVLLKGILHKISIIYKNMRIKTVVFNVENDRHFSSFISLINSLISTLK